jgi:hypothetical protein
MTPQSTKFSPKIIGWELKHKDTFIYRAKSGSPILHLKFHHYANFHQTVQVVKKPSEVKIKKKGKNSFMVFNKKVRSKGQVILDRTVKIFPQIKYISSSEEWGMISDISGLTREKYQVQAKFWPVNSRIIQDIASENWFRTDNLKIWILNARRFIVEKITLVEKQKSRLGVIKALNDGVGDCDEFADILVTLARLKGIPCRRITGFFIRFPPVKAEPHAWTELYSPKLGWITIDLALGNVGHHNINYVVLKVEEFHSHRSDYSSRIDNATAVESEWIHIDPEIQPIFSD